MTEIFEQLDINSTFFIEFALFVVFFALLSFIYLKPFQKLIEGRSHKLKEDVQGASELLRTVENKLNDYENAIARVRHESLQNYEKVMSEVRSKEEATLSAYKDELKKEYMKANELLQGERQKVESELQGQVSQMADALANQVLSGK